MSRLGDKIGRDAILHYLLHRLGGSVTMNQDATIDAYRDFDLCYCTNPIKGGQITISLKARSTKRL